MDAKLFEERFRDETKDNSLLMRVQDKHEESLRDRGLVKITNLTTSLQLTLQSVLSLQLDPVWLPLKMCF